MGWVWRPRLDAADRAVPAAPASWLAGQLGRAAANYSSHRCVGVDNKPGAAMQRPVPDIALGPAQDCDPNKPRSLLLSKLSQYFLDIMGTPVTTSDMRTFPKCHAEDSEQELSRCIFVFTCMSTRLEAKRDILAQKA